jgi:hypothetical protein
VIAVEVADLIAAEAAKVIGLEVAKRIAELVEPCATR